MNLSLKVSLKRLRSPKTHAKNVGTTKLNFTLLKQLTKNDMKHNWSEVEKHIHALQRLKVRSFILMADRLEPPGFEFF